MGRQTSTTEYHVAADFLTADRAGRIVEHPGFALVQKLDAFAAGQHRLIEQFQGQSRELIKVVIPAEESVLLDRYAPILHGDVQLRTVVEMRKTIDLPAHSITQQANHVIVIRPAYDIPRVEIRVAHENTFVELSISL